MILYFLSGILLGSFLGVLAKRIPIHKDFIYSRSECDHCHTTLDHLDLIPLYVLIFNKNKCRHCTKKIPIYHSLFELLTGSLVLLFKLTIGFKITTIYLFLLLIMSLTLSLTDILYMIVEPKILYFFSFIAYLFFHLNHSFSVHSLSTPVFIFLFFLILTQFMPDSIGGGDIKLLISWAFFLNLIQCLEIILIASFLGIIFILFYQFIFSKTIRKLPFVPFLTFGLMVVTLIFR